MKKITVGLIANVDSGKTTLSEALLYKSGIIRSFGRVDKGMSYFDSNTIERERGITVFSKLAKIKAGDTEIYLLDTPGHTDFTAETERTLDVLDYAVLIISSISLITERDKALLRLLNEYSIPVIIFINKMDITPYSFDEVKDSVLKADDRIVIYDVETDDSLYEEIAERDIDALDEYTETGIISDDTIIKAVFERNVIPAIPGSALKMEGVDELINLLSNYTADLYDYSNASEPAGVSADYNSFKPSDELSSARVFKIKYDDKKERVTFLKVTSGKISTRQEILPGEKISQIRKYSGDRFETVNEALPGDVVGVTGIKNSYPGLGIGDEISNVKRSFEPFLKYSVVPMQNISSDALMQSLGILADEDPMLMLSHDNKNESVTIRVMGSIQLEVISSEMKRRFGMDISFSEGSVEYRETISDKCYGIGHFEPLKHYAEVHVLLTPLKTGSGIIIDSKLGNDVLSGQYQNSIISAIKEGENRGFLIGKLTGGRLTDVKITLVNGKSHIKHTEGGDMREAALRAIRQALMKDKGVLLEPYLEYTLTLPDEMVGKAMNDINNMSGSSSLVSKKDGISKLKGAAPYSCIRNYQEDLSSYTSGKGLITFRFLGYLKCHNEDEVLEKTTYDPDLDVEHPSGSVFCSKGSGYFVPWNEVDDMKHLPYSVLFDNNINDHFDPVSKPAGGTFDYDMSIGLDEIDAIINRSSHANRRESGDKRKFYYEKSRNKTVNTSAGKKKETHDKIILIDGYNLIHAWPKLKELIINDNVTGARDRLIEILSNYRAVSGIEILVVFDAYKVFGHKTEVLLKDNVHIVYTKQAETADQYIARFTGLKSKEFDITVVTSDGMVQLIVRSKDSMIMSSREFIDKVINETNDFNERFIEKEF